MHAAISIEILFSNGKPFSKGAAPQPSHRLPANSTGSRRGLLCTVRPLSAARFAYQFLLGLAGCTALQLRSKDTK